MKSNTIESLPGDAADDDFESLPGGAGAADFEYLVRGDVHQKTLSKELPMISNPCLEMLLPMISNGKCFPLAIGSASFSGPYNTTPTSQPCCGGFLPFVSYHLQLSVRRLSSSCVYPATFD